MILLSEGFRYPAHIVVTLQRYTKILSLYMFTRKALMPFPFYPSTLALSVGAYPH